MKIGISVSNYGQLPSRDFLKTTALKIEELGLDSIWTSDHIIVPKENKPWNRVFETLATLGFFASITDKVQLGTSILLVPLREPFALAKQIATIDSLSNGRLIIGVGIGWNKKEFELVGYDFKNITKTIAKNLDLMKKMWSGGFIDSGYSCEPMPFTENGPPILVGGQSKGAIKRVAMIGDGWHPVGISAKDYEKGIQQITSIEKRDYIWTLRMNFAANQNVESHYTGTDGSPRLRLAGKTNEIISQIQEYKKIGLEHLVCDIRADSTDDYFEQLHIVSQIKKSF
ncbi:MAG: LLM class flavin-dependent oxidoreductase [Nitrosopumilaceae archaeon]|nr:LLM class flavin-dependent oxidoreductase [Nitrosopumilaceae archaeon]